MTSAEKRVRAFCGAEFSLCAVEMRSLELPKGVTYFCASPEVCPSTGAKHLQFFIYFKSAKTIAQAMKWVKKNLGFTRPLTVCKGTPADNRRYCGGEAYEHEGKKKDANPEFFEVGDLPMKGKRQALTDTKDAILAGEVTVDELAETDPEMVHQYGRTLDRLEDIRLRKMVRTKMTKGIWYWGPTGVGKSHRAANTPGTQYWVPNDGGWWDGYRQEDVVILNDFRGHIAYGELLQMVDKWPYAVRRRGRQPMPFTSGTVVVTSSLHPREVYKNLAMNDSLAQLERRFEIVELTKTEVEKNT